MLGALDRIIEPVPRGERQVVFFGGEPLLRFDVIRSVVRTHPEYAFTLNTNGTLVNARVAGFLADHGISVSLALDGTAATHDLHRKTAGGSSTHAKVVRTFELLTRTGVPTLVRMTVTPQSAEGLTADVAFLGSLGVERIGIAPAAGMTWRQGPIEKLQGALCALAERYVSPARGGLPEIADFERAREGRAAACRPGVDTLTIASDGAVLPCHRSPLADAARLIVESPACGICPAYRYCTRCIPKLGSIRPGALSEVGEARCSRTGQRKGAQGPESRNGKQSMDLGDLKGRRPAPRLAGEGMPGFSGLTRVPACPLKLAFARAYDMIRTANTGGREAMEKYTVIEGNLYKIPPDVLKKYQLSEEEAHKAKATGKAPKAPKSEPPFKGNWYELGESDCF
jgi:hypothetical protein